MRLILMRSNVSILSHCIPLYPTRDKRDVSHRGSRLKTMNQMVFLAIYIYMVIEIDYWRMIGNAIHHSRVALRCLLKRHYPF